MITDCFEQQLPINAVEVAFHVDVGPPTSPPAALACRTHGIDCRAAGSVAIGVGMEHRLKTRLQITAGGPPGGAGCNPRESQPAEAGRPPPELPPPPPGGETTARGQPSPEALE